MSSVETAAMVALLRSGTRRPSVYADLVDECGSAVAVLERDRGANSTQPRLFDYETVSVPELLATATSDIARWASRNMRVVTVLDADYPVNLRMVHDRPPLIFVHGQLGPSDVRSIAVIGARRASPKGVALAGAIAEHLVECSYTVASGLAVGIDTAVHTATLKAGGRTLAVIGTGLARCYPRQNAGLQAEISRRGAVISQFWPDAPPSRKSFPMRNALMSGLTLATVIVEATLRSGARIQARRALGHGRPVFVPHSLLAESWARDLASRPGVHVVGDAHEITAAVDRLTAPEPLLA